MIRLRPHGLPTPHARAGALRSSADHAVGRYDVVPYGSERLQALVRQVAYVVDVPMAAVNLMKTTTQRTVAAVGLDVTILDRTDAMCAAIIGEGRPVHVADARRDPRWAANPFVDGRRGHIRFYAAQPLVAPSGAVIGTLCVFDDRPRRLDTFREEALQDMAEAVVRILEEKRVSTHKMQTRRLLNRFSGWM